MQSTPSFESSMLYNSYRGNIARSNRIWHYYIITFYVLSLSIQTLMTHYQQKEKVRYLAGSIYQQAFVIVLYDRKTIFYFRLLI